MHRAQFRRSFKGDLTRDWTIRMNFSFKEMSVILWIGL